MDDYVILSGLTLYVSYERRDTDGQSIIRQLLLINI